MKTYDLSLNEKRRIELETDAEIAFGTMLEKAGVDCDAFMQQWRITHHQFNLLSHYLYGLTEEVPELPSALTVLLIAGRQQKPIAA